MRIYSDDNRKELVCGFSERRSSYAFRCLCEDMDGAGGDIVMEIL